LKKGFLIKIFELQSGNLIEIFLAAYYLSSVFVLLLDLNP